MQQSNLILEKIYLWLLTSLLAVFFLAPKIANLIVVVTLLFFFFLAFRKRGVFKLNRPFVFGALLYFAYALGCFFTFDNQDRLHYLASKLPFLLLPLLFSLKVDFKAFNLKMKLLVLWIFIGLATAVCFVHAAGLPREFLKGNTPYSSAYFSFIHHPSYWVAMTQSLLVLTYFFQKKFHFRFPLYLWIVFAALVVLNTYFATSLAGAIGFIICFGAIFIDWMTSILGKRKALVLLLIAGGLFVFGVSKVTFVNTALAPIRAELSHYSKDPGQYIKDETGYKTGDQKRLIMWRVAYEVITEHPFGVGTGNIDYFFSKRLFEYKQFDLAKEELNPHNQFLQIGVELGIAGIFLLLFIFTAIFYDALKTQNYSALIIGLITFINALFESILQRSSGIIFFTFIFALMYFVNRNYKHEN